MSLARTPVDRIFIDTTSSVVSRTTLPNFQRPDDKSHIDEIYDSIMALIKTGLEPQLTGCLITVVLKDTYYLLDGNHRLHAYWRVYEDCKHDLRVYVQEIHVDTLQQAEDLFKQTNNSLPVAKMPDGVKRSSVNSIAKYFYTKYAATIGKRKPLFVSTNANRPRVSRVKFEEMLAQVSEAVLGSGPKGGTGETSGTCGLDEQKIITTIDEYIASLNRKNYTWFKRNTNDTRARLEKMLGTADGLGCRLGMVRLGEVIKLFNVAPIAIFQRKDSIPIALKTKVWNIYCGQNTRISKCPFCEDEIRLERFHCAHDVAEADGGQAGIDNLYPCCATCNLSMGKKTYSEFKESFARS